MVTMKGGVTLGQKKSEAVRTQWRLGMDVGVFVEVMRAQR